MAKSESCNHRTLKVLIITQSVNPIVSAILKAHVDVIGIVESAPRSYDPKHLFSLGRIKFWINLLLKPGKNLRLSAYLKQIPYFLFYQPNGVQLRKFVEHLRPDLIVVYSMSQLLEAEVFSFPIFGTINLHPSLLPAYRGPNPRFWIYNNMEQRRGITLHYVDRGEDTGNIVAQESLDLPLGLPCKAYDESLLKLGSSMVIDAIRMLEVGEVLPSEEQPRDSPTIRARRLSKKDYQTLIDWQELSVEKIWHVFQGTPNWPDFVSKPKGFWLKCKNWTLCSYSLYSQNQERHPVATLERMREGSYTLHCKDGYILLRARNSITQALRALLAA